jgi:REP element-mobilizing transposase RayT
MWDVRYGAGRPRPYGVTIYNSIMVKFDPKIHHRRSIRLQEYDYSQVGAYFVTMVTWQRESLFGKVVNGEMLMNKFGKIVEWEWLDLPKRLSYVGLGSHMVMPNHFHGILFIHETVGATRHGQTISLSGKEPSPTSISEGMDGSPLPHGPKPASLGAIIAQFKSRVTKRIWKSPEFKNTPIWQRNYYEHIIRDEKDLQNKTDYIEANPLLWDEDDENPVNVKP